MDNKIYTVGNNVNCTECGKEISITYFESYQYRVRGGYQCSYTCYDHAKLRLSKSNFITKENFIKYAKDSERRMKSQGKVILHPINLNE